jgi:hypothetical protein
MNVPVLNPDQLRAQNLRAIALVDLVLDACAEDIGALKAQAEYVRREDPGRPVDGLRQLALERTARVLRYCIVLQNRIALGELVPPSKPADDYALAVERKLTVASVVEDVILEQDPHCGETAERLIDRLDAHLTTDRPEDYLTRPIGEMIGIICEGLGIAPDWDRWIQEPWALEEILTHRRGSPYAAHPRAALRLERARQAREAAAEPEAEAEDTARERPMTELEWADEHVPDEHRHKWGLPPRKPPDPP